MSAKLKQIQDDRARKRLNTKDWEELNKLEGQLKEQYSQHIAPVFYQYGTNPGLLAIYEYGGKVIARIQLVADLSESK